MNYQKIYTDLINRALYRLIEDNVYYETHHIIPKCMGGTNNETNLVKLTYREHFIAHWLLHKIYNTNKSIEFAFKFMAYGNGFIKTKKRIPSSRILEKKKIILIKTFSSKEHKDKVKAGRIKNLVICNDIKENRDCLKLKIVNDKKAEKLKIKQLKDEEIKIRKQEDKLRKKEALKIDRINKLKESDKLKNIKIKEKEHNNIKTIKNSNKGLVNKTDYKIISIKFNKDAILVK